MSREEFVETFGDIFEHTPEIAAATFDAGLTSAENNAAGLHAAMVRQMRGMSDKQQRALIERHPDLAGKLAFAKGLTADSNTEQGSAGLDSLTPEELIRFTALNETYRKAFGFPFIMAVRGSSKQAILAAFEARLDNTAEQEFETALTQIERIALLRLEARFQNP